MDKVAYKLACTAMPSFNSFLWILLKNWFIYLFIYSFICLFIYLFVKIKLHDKPCVGIYAGPDLRLSHVI